MNRPHSHRNLLWSGHWPVVFHIQTGTLLYSLFVSWSFYWQSNGRVDGFTMCTLSDAYLSKKICTSDSFFSEYTICDLERLRSACILLCDSSPSSNFFPHTKQTCSLSIFSNDTSSGLPSGKRPNVDKSSSGWFLSFFFNLSSLYFSFISVKASTFPSVPINIHGMKLLNILSLIEESLFSI